MPLWLQHLLVLAAVAGAAIYVLRQVVATLRAGKGGFGSCCAKGCPPPQSQVRPRESPASLTNPPERIVFLPADALGRRRPPKGAQGANHEATAPQGRNRT